MSARKTSRKLQDKLKKLTSGAQRMRSPTKEMPLRRSFFISYISSFKRALISL